MKATTGRIAPLHIRSQAVKGAGSSLRIGAGSGMTAFPLDIAEQAPTPMKRGAWRERDLRRALAVARCAKLRNYSVEIAPDGTISIVVGSR
jgi:hypothetical protein